MKDPGSLSVPCTIGNVEFLLALCELGASVLLIPLIVAKQLGLNKLKQLLAGRSIKHPWRALENFLVKADKSIISVDFVVLDLEEDLNIYHFMQTIFRYNRHYNRR